MSPTVTPTAKMMLDLLRRHHIKPSDELPGGVFLTEVPAPHASRRADALYIGFTGSRGHHINVFEIKVTRADWLSELADPTKAEAWWNHCHNFIIVCPRGVVKMGELPEGWGLWHPGKSKIRMDVEVKPTLHEPKITMGLLLEVAKKLDLYRAASEREVRRDIERRASEMANRALEEERKHRGAFDLSREKEARETLDQLAKLTGLRFPGSMGGKTWASLDESAGAIQDYCKGAVERKRLERRSVGALKTLHKDIGEILGEMGHG